MVRRGVRSDPLRICARAHNYDNLKAAVVRVLKGRRRVESDRFVALRSHFRFDSSFCLSGKQGAHEKGGVEGEVGRFRRRHLVPVPQVGSIEELNELLEEACWKDLERTITGHSGTVGERLDRERLILGTLPREPHPTWEEATPRVDAKALATVRTNRYSVPARLAGLKIRARVGARDISFWHDGTCVAQHERLQRVCSSDLLATVRTNRYSVPARLAGLKIRARVGARDISFWHDGTCVAQHERL